MAILVFLVIHGRASSMVERYSMAGEVSQHHVPLQCGDPVEMTRLRLYTGIHRETVFQVSRKLTNRPGFPGQSRFEILCPGILNVVFGTPKCPGLASEFPGGTECYPSN